MDASQQQSSNRPVVRCGCVPTQEGDGRGVLNSDTALTQLVQGAQHARGQSINPWVQKLTRKYTKVVTIKTVNNVTTERVTLVYGPVYCRNGVPAAILEKVKPVLDTSYKIYVSDSKGADKDKLPHYFQPVKRQKVLKKDAAFYSQVPMPCVVAEPVKLLSNTKNAKYHVIPAATRETFMRLMEDTTDYRKASAIVRISE
ncbi:hypothetical protein DSO57_1036157 [Entomophthora muscae]|uniref:Uncharacterized protein n=1 Tax=Entomophthora muscae TaxID=34485 RepID=A0ACC2SZG9_9FUNG|nr:hypothetical protein DSO57_1036157 [Entomophthora muscae]